MWFLRCSMHWLVGLTAALSIAIATGSATWAADKVLPIGVAEFPPFKYLSEDGKIIGADTEIVEQVILRMGYTPDIQMQPWKRVQQSGEIGQFAAIYSFTKTPEREQFYYFSDPINTVKDVFFKLKKNNTDWNNLEDLRHVRIAVSAGYSYAEVFKDAIKQKKLEAVYETTNTTPEIVNLRNLVRERIDLTICEVSVCSYLIKSHAAELSDLDFIAKSIGPVRTFHVGFSKKWPNAEQLNKQFNAELAKFVAAGLRKKIYEKYNIVTDLP